MCYDAPQLDGKIKVVAVDMTQTSSTAARREVFRARLTWLFSQPNHAFWLIVLNGVLFQLSFALFDPRRVVAAFLTDLTGREWLVGLAIAIQPTSMTLPQLYASHQVADGRPRMPYYIRGAAVRWVGTWLAVLAVVTLHRQTLLLATLFLLLIGVIGAGTGLGVVAFGDIVIRTVPAHRRGRLFGLRIALGSLLALAMGGLVKRVLSPSFPWPFPYNYALLFAISAVILMLAQACFMRVQEPPVEPRPRPAEHFGGYLRHAWRVLRRDPNAQRYILYRLVAPAGWVPVSLSVPYAMKVLGFGAQVVGWFMIASVLAAAASNVVWARLSDRVGNRVCIRLGTACVVTGVGLMALTPLIGEAVAGSGPNSVVLIWLIAVNALSEVGQTGVNLGGLNYTYELAQGPEAPLYIGALQSFSAPALAITPPLMALLAQRHGYPAIYVLGLLLGAMALYTTLLLREPRRASP
ncbi:MAG: MFS transporter [Fimbriimonadaceae bacterium]|nr:MFS transporter [Fimbriimonadaceae bacterium]